MTPVFPQNAFCRIDLTTSVLLLLPVVIVIIISSFLLFLLLRANSSPTSSMTGLRKLARIQLELLRHVLDLSLSVTPLLRKTTHHTVFISSGSKLRLSQTATGLTLRLRVFILTIYLVADGLLIPRQP